MASAITLATAIEVFEKEYGCSDRSEAISEIAAAIEYLLLNGGGDILREWRIPVVNGRFAFPRDLETPIKYKIGRYASGGYGIFHSAYLSYSSRGVLDCGDYLSWDNNKFAVAANPVQVQFFPNCRVQVLATTEDERDIGKKIMVGGKQSGQPIAPMHNGFKTSGELLTIQDLAAETHAWSSWCFDEITSVIKDLTCSYVTIHGKDSTGNTYTLAAYHPDEEEIRYRQGQIFGGFPYYKDNELSFELCVLGRVNPTIRYIRDEDVLPIASYELLRLLAKRARYDASGDFDKLGATEQRIARTIRKFVAYQQAPGRAPGVYVPGSGGGIKNI